MASTEVIQGHRGLQRQKFGAGLGANAVQQRFDQLRNALMGSSLTAGTPKEMRDGVIEMSSGVLGSTDGNPPKGMPDELLSYWEMCWAPHSVSSYIPIKQIGEGTYGVVTQAIRGASTGESGGLSPTLKGSLSPDVSPASPASSFASAVSQSPQGDAKLSDSGDMGISSQTDHQSYNGEDGVAANESQSKSNQAQSSLSRKALASVRNCLPDWVYSKPTQPIPCFHPCRNGCPSGTKVALKRVKTDRNGVPVTAIREIHMLKLLNHPNIVRLIDVVSSHTIVHMGLKSSLNQAPYRPLSLAVASSALPSNRLVGLPGNVPQADPTSAKSTDGLKRVDNTGTISPLLVPANPLALSTAPSALLQSTAAPVPVAHSSVLNPVVPAKYDVVGNRPRSVLANQPTMPLLYRSKDSGNGDGAGPAAWPSLSQEAGTGNGNVPSSTVANSDMEAGKDGEGNIFLVFELCEGDLTDWMEIHQQNAFSNQQRSGGFRITPEVCQYVFHNLLKGLEYCHMNGILHRDVKPANILVTSNGGIKLADFGLTRQLPPKGASTVNMQTLWYRAPEVLLMSGNSGEHAPAGQTYDTKVDIWSAGCILGELLIPKRTMFPGGGPVGSQKDPELDQFCKIVEICGSIDESEWSDVIKYEKYHAFTKAMGDNSNSRTSNPSLHVIPAKSSGKLQINRRLIAEYRMTGASNLVLDLLDSLLTWSPLRRLTATQALAHDYFFSPEEPLTQEEFARRFCDKLEAAQHISGSQALAGAGSNLPGFSSGVAGKPRRHVDTDHLPSAPSDNAFGNSHSHHNQANRAHAPQDSMSNQIEFGGHQNKDDRKTRDWRNLDAASISEVVARAITTKTTTQLSKTGLGLMMTQPDVKFPDLSSFGRLPGQQQDALAESSSMPLTVEQQSRLQPSMDNSRRTSSTYENDSSKRVRLTDNADSRKSDKDYDRDRRRDKDRDRDRDRDKDRDKDREKYRERDRDRDRDRDRERDRDRDRGRDRDRDKERDRDRDRDRERDRDRDRDRDRERDRDRDRDRDRARDRDRTREGDRDRDKAEDEGTKPKGEKEQRDDRSNRSREDPRYKERGSDRAQSRERDRYGGKTGPVNDPLGQILVAEGQRHSIPHAIGMSAGPAALMGNSIFSGLPSNIPLHIPRPPQQHQAQQVQINYGFGSSTGKK